MKILRHLPAVNQLKDHSRFLQILASFRISEKMLVKWLDEPINIIRNKIINNELNTVELNRDILIGLIFDELDKVLNAFNRDNLQAVINATGVVLHTNLGRARLSQNAIEQIKHTASTYSTLEYNVATGERGSRHDVVEDYLKQLTGAEAALVVNNNAAAVYLILKAIASNGEVIVSRGELVEIGGTFRISEIMKESQAELVDIGTTNKTRVMDYENAITENTALLMKVHKSNFKMIGFTEEVNTDELVVMSEEHQIPIYEDLGSGTLFNFREQSVGEEPTVQEKVNEGIDIISFSGDKLLGGPQAGIIVGKKTYVDKLKNHQLARVLRVDKFTLAGLEATLKSYLREQEEEIPTVRDILEPKESVLDKANTFIKELSNSEKGFIYEIELGRSKVGGGTMPDVGIETYVVKVKHEDYTAAEIARELRSFKVPIIVRVKNEAVVLDFRTVGNIELMTVIEAFKQLFSEKA